jgi:hypothetical protein
LHQTESPRTGVDQPVCTEDDAPLCFVPYRAGAPGHSTGSLAQTLWLMLK